MGLHPVYLYFVFTITMTDLFTVCKIEAGRAVLLSQNDFELIEFPAKLLPPNWENGGAVSINVSPAAENSLNDKKTKELLNEIERDYCVEGERIEEIKRELSNCLRIENLGCTAAILTWNRPISQIFGPKIRIENVLMDIESPTEPEYFQEYVDFVLKGLKPISIEDTLCRVNLPIDLNVKLLIETSVGYFKSNKIGLSCKKFEDFSGIIVLTDLTEPTETINRLEFLREQGGYIIRQYTPDQPITAVVTGSFDSPLFKLGIDYNLPVVSDTWLEALVATRELPHFEDHLLKRS